MNQISIKSNACNTPEVKIRRKITRNGNKTSILKFCTVTYLYLAFLYARIIHDGTLYKKVSQKFIIFIIILVQFSVNYNMPFFDIIYLKFY